MRFAIINDMHVGTTGGDYKGVQRKLISESERLVNEFVKRMNEVVKPEFVVNLGDSIEDVKDREIDIVYLKKSMELLKKLDMPVYTLVGNHDVKTLTQEEVAKLLGLNKMYYSFDHGDYHFIVISFHITGDPLKNPGDIGAILPPEQLKWLREDLGKTDKDTVIFSHYGLADDDMVGNFWMDSQPDKGNLVNRAEVRQILEDSNKVRAVISAHQHWNRMFVHNQIPYFTVTSLIENFKNDGKPSEAHTIVDLEEKKITVDVQGNDPARYEYIS